MSFTPSYVHNNHLLHTGNRLLGAKARMYNKKHTRTTLLFLKDSKYNVKLFIQYLCQKGIDAIHNIHTMNTGASSYLQRTLEN